MAIHGYWRGREHFPLPAMITDDGRWVGFHGPRRRGFQSIGLACLSLRNGRELSAFCESRDSQWGARAS